MNAIRELIFDNIIYAYWYGWREVGYVFFTSMIPVLELRAAIAFGPAHHMPWVVTYLAAVIGNLIPVPFIILFVRKVFAWLRRVPALGGLVDRMEAKADKNKEKVLRYAKLGLFLFVAIPLPGTGAWTGALVAAMLDIRLKKAFPSIAAGVLSAGLLMTFFYYFLANAFPRVSYTRIVLALVGIVLLVLLVVWSAKKLNNKTGN